MQVGLKAAYDCVKAFSETDLTEDLKKIDVPDPDRPRATTTRSSRSTTPRGCPSKLVKDATLKIYPGAPHGLANTTAYKDTLNADLLAFLRG